MARVKGGMNAKKKGKITITAAARSNPGLSKSVTVNISKINTNKVTDSSMHIVKKISLNKKSIVMKRGKKKKLKVKVTPSNASNAQISWQSSNRKVAVLVQKASMFDSNIYIESEGKKVNAKSIMGMMSLGLNAGEEVTVIAEGADEGAAVDSLEEYISGNAK